METNLLVVVSVIFALSLVGAFVLFKFLKSAAIIKRSGYQAGGALAGFLLIFGALYASYSRLEASAAEREAQVALWTVIGEVHLEGDVLDSVDVEVSFMPPPPKALSKEGGRFRFDNIEMTSHGTPELQFEVPGYFSQTLLLDDDVAEFDPKNRRIELKKPVVLVPLGSTRAPPGAARGSLSGKIMKHVRARSALSGARIELLAPGTDEVRQHAFSDGNGGYSLLGIAPGTYEIRVWLGQEQLEVMSPEPPTVDIEAGQDLVKIVTVRTPQGG